MRSLQWIFPGIAIAAMLGCGPSPAGNGDSHHVESKASVAGNIAATAVFGGVSVTAMQLQCVGRVQLAQGQASVRDGCFSGDTNVVLCTDATAANPIKCAAAPGKLEIAGTGSDLINYARIR